MTKSYYYKNLQPIKVISKEMPTSIDDTGTGWIYADIDDMLKPELKKVNGEWQIVDAATPEEVEKARQDELENQIDILNEKFKSDGLEYQRQIKNRVTAQLAGRSNVIPILAEINKTVYVLLNKIAAGDWVLAMLDYMDGDNNPTIQEVVDIFNEVGQKATQYYQDEYPH